MLESGEYDLSRDHNLYTKEAAVNQQQSCYRFMLFLRLLFQLEVDACRVIKLQHTVQRRRRNRKATKNTQTDIGTAESVKQRLQIRKQFWVQ